MSTQQPHTFVSSIGEVVILTDEIRARFPNRTDAEIEELMTDTFASQPTYCHTTGSHAWIAKPNGVRICGKCLAL